MLIGARPLRLEPEGLKNLKLPVILHWDLSHFVVLDRITSKKAWIRDPAVGKVVCSISELQRRFSGVALEFTPTERFLSAPRNKLKRNLKVRDLFRSIESVKANIAKIIILTIVAQAFSVIAPLFQQVAIDNVVLTGDVRFLTILLISFISVFIILSIAELMRSLVALTLGQVASYSLSSRLVSYLFQLPIEYFEKRHSGDVISRIGSIQPVQRMITNDIPTAFIDLVTCVVLCLVMINYDTHLFLIVLMISILQIGVFFLFYPSIFREEAELIIASADEQSHLIESIYAVNTVKIFNSEAVREAAWRNLFASVTKRIVLVGQIKLLSSSLWKFLGNLQFLLVIYFGIMAILSENLTVGMIFAFITYLTMFSVRFESLLSSYERFRLLGLHLDRLDDIVSSEVQAEVDGASHAFQSKKITGEIEFRDVDFSYGPADSLIFKDANLTIQTGEYVAIIGKSGAGKTTLLNLLLGIQNPIAGEVLINDTSLTLLGVRKWRENVGVVMQNDRLLTGTLAENISFFDPSLDLNRVMEVAVQAEIHQEIMSMPMNYYSLVGDMGSALSGGQKQRILLARALYRNPQVLILDEGTANLDEKTELAIATLLDGLSITRIVIAHRPALISKADRVLEVRDRGVFEIESELLK